MIPPAFRLTDPRLADEYDNMLACIRCGACLTSCPTYVLSLHEAEGPRGRIGLARAVAEGQLAITPDLLAHEMNCLVCDACSAVCPAGVHMDPLQVVFRTAVAEQRHLSWIARVVRNVVFGWLFMDMARFRLFARAMWLYQRSGLRWLARNLGVLRLLGLAETERLLPELPASFVAPHDETYPATGTATATSPSPSPSPSPSAGSTSAGSPTPVGFFAGCVMSTALADVDRATIRVLQRGGCSVSNPGRQGCCGALHAHGGDLPRALELARRNIQAFEATAGPIVVNSAGCGAMLKDYAHHLRNDPDWAERARTFSERVRDLSQVLTPASLASHRTASEKVVYQDACHLLHAQRISRQPRDLLKAIPGVELVEIAEAGLCCGSAGIYNLTNPVESKQLQERKVDNALNVAPDLIVTGNPGCLLQLRSGLAARGSRVAVKHLAEVLDEATAP